MTIEDEAQLKVENHARSIINAGHNTPLLCRQLLSLEDSELAPTCRKR